MNIRKFAMIVLAAGMGWTSAQGQQPAAPQAVSGKVFLDANANGVLDAGEKGIAGVRVSDGAEFVVTADDGSYTIKPAADPMFKFRPAQTVTVCWPSGKWPTSRYWMRLADMKDAAAVHFGLREDKQTLPFMYLQHSDSHCRFPNGCDAFAAFVNSLGSEVKFVLDTGDTSFGESAEGQTFTVLTEAEKKFKVPFMHVIGNHDVVPPGKPELEGHGAWTKDLGPMRWAFDYADVHFVGIDCYEEAVRPEVVEWLERDFKAQPKGKRIVLSYHYPNPDGGKFHKMLKEYNVQLIHAGHNHQSIYWMNWPAPMVTVHDYKPLGNANAVVVTDTGVHSGYYCLGCKSKPFTHSRRCPMLWDTHVLLSAVTKLFGNVTKIENKPLAGAGEAVPFTTTKAFIQAQIDPGSAKRVVMTIAGKAAALKIEYTGDHLIVDGAPLRFDIKQADKLLNLRVFVQKGMVTVWADGYFFIEKETKVCVPGAVTMSADGGAATIKTLTVSEIKPDASPDTQQGGYHNNGIGGPRRTAD